MRLQFPKPIQINQKCNNNETVTSNTGYLQKSSIYIQLVTKTKTKEKAWKEKKLKYSISWLNFSCSCKGLGATRPSYIQKLSN